MRAFVRCFKSAQNVAIIGLEIINGTVHSGNFTFPSMSLRICTSSFLLAFFPPTSDVIKNHLVDKSNNCGHSVALRSSYLIPKGPFAPSSG